MFDTNDVYNDAVRGSSVHTEENMTSSESLGSNILATILLAGIAYVGFNYYTSNYSMLSTVEKDLVVKNKLVAEIQVESELQIVPRIDNSEADYLMALRELESELVEKNENISLDTNEQMDLSLAMNDLMNDTLDNTHYTNELRKEIGVELDKVVETSIKKDSRRVVVKKGDTLQSISDEFYGDAMNYKRIIASNASLNYNDTTIYEGQTILLPY